MTIRSINKYLCNRVVLLRKRDNVNVPTSLTQLIARLPLSFKEMSDLSSRPPSCRSFSRSHIVELLIDDYLRFEGSREDSLLNDRRRRKGEYRLIDHV